MLRNHAHFSIAGREVGDRHPLFVIAEIGLNHGGSLACALDMVDQAASAGVSAVKLQTLVSKQLVAPACPAPAHVEAASMTDFFEGFELDEAAHRAIASRARERGLAFISTPLSLDSVDMLLRVGVDAFKVASGDITWDGLIDRIARTGKPIIISTGMASLDEVSHAVATARLAGADHIALLHCVSAYPVPWGSENLAAIQTLSGCFETPVGLSDHGDDTFAVAVAVAFGASIYERHLMLEGDTDAVDAAVSSTPAEFAAIVRTAARAAASIGSGEKRCQPVEAPNLIPSRRALYAAIGLQAGEVVRDGDLVALRPCLGVEPGLADRLVGARLRRNLNTGEPISLHHVVSARVERKTA